MSNDIVIALEVCIDSIESALNANEGFADRLELCSSLSEGGLTPTQALLKVTKENVQIPVFCMVRPRGGPMVYSQKEREVILLEAKKLKEEGADGLVFGALTSDGEVDIPLCTDFMKVADGLPCTFHRAIDLTSNPMKALEDVINLGFTRVLTSGTKASAVEGASVIRRMNEYSRGRIKVMAGAGVRADNCLQLLHSTGVSEIHTSAKIKKVFPINHCNSARMGTNDERWVYVASAQEVKSIMSELKKIRFAS